MGTIATAVIAAVALVLSAGALITAASASVRAGSAPPPAADAPTAPSQVTVDLAEFSIAPSDIEIAAGGTLVVTNRGAIEHDLEVIGTGLATPMLGAGGTHELSLAGLAPGTYELHCTVPGHDSAGMTGRLVVVGDGAAPAAAAGDHSEHDTGDDIDWAALDAAMTESILAYPADTEGRGNQLLEPEEVLADGTKVFRLVAEIIDWEVEPGKIVEGWSYNGQIPGPQIRVDVGDRVRVHVENHLPMGTDVHWHGVRVPNDQDGVAPLTQPLIQPGDTYTYEFDADEPAIGMYHPHHHGQIKLPNGMFGAFIIGDMGTDIPLPTGRTISGRTVPDDLEVVAEIPMILNDAGTIGLTINGKGWPATEPIVVTKATGSSSTTTTRGCRSIRCTCTRCPSWWSPRTASPSTPPSGRTPSTSRPVSATRCWCRRPTRVCGRSTATSSPTRSATRGCSGWSPR
jgi:manganese oxidase